MPLLTHGPSRLLGGARGLPWYRAGGAPLPVASYQPKGAANLAASYINLANPGTNHAAPGTAPTWNAATGWTFNGTSQYLTTGITTARTWSYIVRFAGVTNNGVLFGGGSSGHEADVKPSDADGKRYHSQGGYLGITPGVTAGILATAGNKSYKDGVPDAGTIPAGSGEPTYPIYIGAGNWNGTVNFWCGAQIQAIAIYNVTLTPAQVASVTAAMQAL